MNSILSVIVATASLVLVTGPSNAYKTKGVRVNCFESGEIASNKFSSI